LSSNYDPFKSDVYSLGVVLLLMALNVDIRSSGERNPEKLFDQEMIKQHVIFSVI
jgi:hypothetical protein